MTAGASGCMIPSEYDRVKQFASEGQRSPLAGPMNENGPGGCGSRPARVTVPLRLDRVGRLVAGELPQLLHDPHVQLADPLLRDAQLAADLLERLRLAAVEAGPQPHDLAIPRGQVFKQSV